MKVRIKRLLKPSETSEALVQLESGCTLMVRLYGNWTDMTPADSELVFAISDLVSKFRLDHAESDAPMDGGSGKAN